MSAAGEINRKSQIVRSPFTGDALLSIERVPAGLETLKRKGALPILGGKVLDPFIRQIPILAAVEGFEGAFILKIPPGVHGQLMQHKANDYLHGTYMTAIQGADGKIQAQAGLQSISFLQAPLMAFVIMSAITGQYFQAKIESTMRHISSQIAKMIDLILAEKESDLGSIYHFTQYVRENFSTIKGQAELRLATLTNIQRNNIYLFSLQKFYEKSIHIELDQMSNTGKAIKAATFFKGSEIADLKSKIQNVSDYLEKQQLSIDLYMVGRVFEIQLSSLYDSQYLKNFQQSIGHIEENGRNLINHVSDIHQDLFEIKRVKENQDIQVGERTRNLRRLKERKAKNSESVASISASIDDLMKMDEKGAECLYCDNQLFLIES
jgi:hypothetical protein